MNKENRIDYFVDDLIKRHNSLEKNRASIIEGAKLLIESAKNGSMFLICGNGGSSADADHIVGELMKGFLLKRPLTAEHKELLKTAGGELGMQIGEGLQQAIPAVSLSTHTSLNTAFINDADPSLMFAQQVMGLGKPNDVLWGLSTSGNSKNVVTAAVTAKAMGLKTFAMTGKTGGKLSEICDVCIRVEETETYKIQELHLPVYHTLCIILEDFFFA